MHLISIGHCPCGKRGTLIDARCGFCDDALTRTAVPRPLTVAALLAALVAELAEEVPQPLSTRFTLASVVADLCRLAGEPVPAVVLDALDGPAAAPHRAETHRERAVPAA